MLTPQIEQRLQEKTSLMKIEIDPDMPDSDYCLCNAIREEDVREILQEALEERDKIILDFQKSAKKFVEKVESGRARSRETYADMKRCLELVSALGAEDSGRRDFRHADGAEEKKEADIMKDFLGECIRIGCKNRAAGWSPLCNYHLGPAARMTRGKEEPVPEDCKPIDNQESENCKQGENWREELNNILRSSAPNRAGMAEELIDKVLEAQSLRHEKEKELIKGKIYNFCVDEFIAHEDGEGKACDLMALKNYLLSLS